MGATAGDLMARDVACGWLREAGHEVEVAVVPPFTGGVNWQTADPAQYSSILFVCGPFGNGEPLLEFFDRFREVPMFGLDLSMLESVRTWNPFVTLWERDSDRTSRPDISFVSTQPRVPVIGTVLIGDQREYGTRAHQNAANHTIAKLLESRNAAVVAIDTCLDPPNLTGLRSPEEIESLIARMDAIVTTRLHGTVLALKNGVPAVVIDSVAGGNKVIRQAQTIGWPIAFVIDELNEEKLTQALDYCLTLEARHAAAECGRRAQDTLAHLQREFVAEMSRQKREAAAR